LVDVEVTVGGAVVFDGLGFGEFFWVFVGDGFGERLFLVFDGDGFGECLSVFDGDGFGEWSSVFDGDADADGVAAGAAGCC
jgi:hypothetical protein